MFILDVAGTRRALDSLRARRALFALRSRGSNRPLLALHPRRALSALPACRAPRALPSHRPLLPVAGPLGAAAGRRPRAEPPLISYADAPQIDRTHLEGQVNHFERDARKARLQLGECAESLRLSEARERDLAGANEALIAKLRAYEGVKALTEATEEANGRLRSQLRDERSEKAKAEATGQGPSAQALQAAVAAFLTGSAPPSMASWSNR